MNETPNRARTVVELLGAKDKRTPASKPIGDDAETNGKLSVVAFGVIAVLFHVPNAVMLWLKS